MSSHDSRLSVTHMITGSHMTTMRKPHFSEEDPWSRVENSKFRLMFAGVNVSFHLYTCIIYIGLLVLHLCVSLLFWRLFFRHCHFVQLYVLEPPIPAVADAGNSR